MKRNFFATLSFGALSILFTAAGAYAQSGVEATVPFAFNVGTTHLPAGRYAIKVDSMSSLVTIRNCNNNARVLAFAQHEYPGEKSHKLVFRHANDQYFLAEIWGEQDSDGMTLRVPKTIPKLEEAKERWPTGDEVMIALK